MKSDDQSIAKLTALLADLPPESLWFVEQFVLFCAGQKHLEHNS